MFFPFWLWLILLILLSPIIIGLALMGLQKKVRLIHPQTGLAKTGYVGWSWTYFLFGWLVPVIRGEIGIGVLHCILTFATFGIFQWIMSMLYNRQYMTRIPTPTLRATNSAWPVDSSGLAHAGRAGQEVPKSGQGRSIEEHLEIFAPLIGSACARHAGCEYQMIALAHRP